MTAATAEQQCRIDDCHDRAARQSMCWRHFNRLRRNGDPMFTTWTVADETDVEIATRRRALPDGATRLERRLIAQKLTERGDSAAEIARITGVTPRTVTRWRAHLRIRKTA
ncbi:helix-turn-helix domain-containing protein [Streptomyces sp. NPDC054840]